MLSTRNGQTRTGGQSPANGPARIRGCATACPARTVCTDKKNGHPLPGATVSPLGTHRVSAPLGTPLRRLSVFFSLCRLALAGTCAVDQRCGRLSKRYCAHMCRVKES